MESSLALDIRLVDFVRAFGGSGIKTYSCMSGLGDAFAIARRQIFRCIVAHENVSDITDTVLGVCHGPYGRVADAEPSVGRELIENLYQTDN